MRLYTKLGVLLVTGLCVTACGPDERSSSGVAGIERELRALGDELCKCVPPGEVRGECYELFPRMSFSIDRCDRAVFSKPEAQSGVNCLISQLRSARSCVSSAMCSREGLAACQEGLDDSSCEDQFPPSIQAELNACAVD